MSSWGTSWGDSWGASWGEITTTIISSWGDSWNSSWGISWGWSVPEPLNKITILCDVTAEITVRCDI